MQLIFVSFIFLHYQELDLKQVISGEEKEKLFEAIGYDGNDAAAAYYPKEVKEKIIRQSKKNK